MVSFAKDSQDAHNSHVVFVSRVPPIVPFRKEEENDQTTSLLNLNHVLLCVGQTGDVLAEM